MKQYIQAKNICNYNQKDQTYQMFMKVLLIMILYRIMKTGIFPFVLGKISILELLLPILLIISCILLCYGGYYVGENFLSKNQYKEEECLMDGILLGLLLPIKTPFWMILIAVFLTIFIGRYFYDRIPIAMPSLIGILGVIGFSIWFQICHLNNSSINFILLEFTETYQLNQISLISVYLGGIGEWISKTSPLLCILAFLYLRKHIKWRIPIYFIGTYLILLIFSNYFISNSWIDILKNLGVGNILFLSLFCGTDMRTTPVTNAGQILFAVFLGIFTYIGTFFFTSYLAIILSILISNLFTPLYDYFGNYYELKYCSEYSKL
ncbi:MAG: RnfABCDGE type electron transport complex subunit D [Bacilli bacterium]|jgi:Na+-translocating ferredoxin:NAD+ oxidoreductase RnfD subunit|nr:RnfABCDGE type electron transport complex subunit D [Bacilli bacterium]